MSFSIICTEDECANGVCQDKCVEDCGGAMDRVAKFACGDAIGGIVCECYPPPDGVDWAAIAVTAAATCVVVTFIWACARYMYARRPHPPQII